MAKRKRLPSPPLTPLSKTFQSNKHLQMKPCFMIQQKRNTETPHSQIKNNFNKSRAEELFTEEDPALQRHNTKNLNQIFPETELRGLSPHFHIHVSVSDLHIPRSGPHFLPAAGIYVYRSWEQTHEWGNWDWGRAIPFLEHINGISLQCDGPKHKRISEKLFI